MEKDGEIISNLPDELDPEGRIFDPISKLPPGVLKDYVIQSFTNLLQEYVEGKVTPYECVKGATILMLGKDVPHNIRTEFMPLCMDIINENIQQQTQHLLKLEHFYELDKHSREYTDELLISMEKVMNGVSSKYDSIKKDLAKNPHRIEKLEKQVRDSFTQIENMTNKIIDNKNRIDNLTELGEKIVDGIAEYNTEMLKIWTNENSKEYRNDEKITRYREEMNSTSCPEKIKECVTKIKDRQMEIHNENVSSKINIQDLGTAIQGISLISRFFGDRETANKISVIGNAVVTTSLYVTGGLLMTNPFTAVVGIMGCVMSMIDVFGSQKDNSMQKIFDKLFDQLNTIRREMHERFDQLEEKIDNMFNTMLNGLSSISRTQNFTVGELMVINKK